VCILDAGHDGDHCTTINRAVRAQLVTIVQATQTEFRAYRTTEHGSYHQAREEAIARLARAEAQSRHMVATNCDGLIFSMEGF